jgi:ketosteroid isomerase-like protein
MRGVIQITLREGHAAVNREIIERVLGAFERKDMDGVLASFADDGVLFDVHYPSPLMQGKDAIRAGMENAFGMLKQPGFTMRNVWEGENNCAVEVDTHHILQNGMEINFPQVFIMEARDGLITRLQSYVPYPPPPLPEPPTA